MAETILVDLQTNQTVERHRGSEEKKTTENRGLMEDVNINMESWLDP